MIGKLFSLLLSLMCLFLLSCKTLSTSSLLGKVEKPRIESVSPRIVGLDFQGIDLAFDVKVRNPYSVPIKSPQFKYGLDVGGANFASSETTSSLDLPARDTGAVVLPLRLEYLDLWQSYERLKDAAEVPYTLHGALISSALGQSIELPIHKSGSFPILRIPDFSNVSVEPPEISLSGARISAKSNVRNPNVFALGLEQLGYNLQIGDIKIGDLKAETLKTIKPGENAEVTLTGTISGMQAIQQLLSGRDLGAARILPCGFVKTPYGSVRLPE